jgi:hypothetical protein
MLAVSIAERSARKQAQDVGVKIKVLVKFMSNALSKKPVIQKHFSTDIWR